MKFEKLDIKHKEIFARYREFTNTASAVHNFVELFNWRLAMNFEVCEEENILFILRRTPSFAFIPPVTTKDEDIPRAYELMRKYTEENNLPKVILDAEQWFLDKSLSQNIDIEYIEDRDNAEYVYDGQKLINLSGKKLHGKKNHYNNFIKNRNYSVKDLREAFDDALIMHEEWLKDKTSDYTLGEFEGVKDTFKHFDEFKLKGIAVYVDGKCEGYTFSEDVGNNNVLTHVEKANDEINGAFTFVNSTNIKLNHPDALFVNREQDLGIEGLRKAKLSWKPVSLIDKYIIHFK